MKYFSLFTGIGGFELGIQLAYELQKMANQSESRTDSASATSQHGEYPLCVGYSEIDKYAIQIYQKHFDHKNYGDITQIDERGLPDFELLCGGFPCQSFSIAGKRGGFEDTRGTLFFDIARIAQHKRPRLLFLENVKGLLSHDSGRTFNTIIAVLDELGYDLQWQVLNSKNHGVPQNRERVFIIGHLRGTPRPEVFPFGENDKENNELPRHYANTLTARYEGAEATGTYIGESQQYAQIKQVNNPTHSNNRVYANSGLAPSLNTMQGGNRQPKIVLAGIIPESHKEKGNYLPRERVISDEGVSRAVTTTENQAPWYETQNRIRRLTPIECERLQGFPDGWTEGISDSQRYKCLGNAVTVNVIRDICERLLVDSLSPKGG